MQVDAYMSVEWMCQTCGEHFAAEPPAAAWPLECPACGSSDVEKEEPVTNPIKRASPYDRGVCPCAILERSGDPRYRR